MDSEIRGVVVVDLESAYDPAGLRFQLHEVVLSGARCIVVDASAIDVLPSSAIAAMLVAHRACRRRGGHLAIRSPSRRALEQLHRTGLRHVLQVEAGPNIAVDAQARAGFG